MVWTPARLVLLAAIGVIAGALNAAAGGGSFLTFPVLVAFGLPPLTANFSNTIAQTPGYLAIAWGYRPELAGQRERIVRLLPAALIGGAAGIAALEFAPAAIFRYLAPALVLFATLLLLAHPWVRPHSPPAAGSRYARLGIVGVGASCAYAAYFGAGAGVLMIAVLGLIVADGLQRLNALSRLLIGIVNLIAATVFAVVGPISWPAVAVLAPATIIGGSLGVIIVRRLPTRLLRAIVITIGFAATAYLITTL